MLGTGGSPPQPSPQPPRQSPHSTWVVHASVCRGDGLRGRGREGLGLTRPPHPGSSAHHSPGQARGPAALVFPAAPQTPSPVTPSTPHSCLVCFWPGQGHSRDSQRRGRSLRPGSPMACGPTSESGQPSACLVLTQDLNDKFVWRPSRPAPRPASLEACRVGVQGRRLHFAGASAARPGPRLEETGSRLRRRTWLPDLPALRFFSLKNLKFLKPVWAGLPNSPQTLHCSAGSRPFTRPFQ